MADQAELAFVNTLLNTLSTQPVNYGDDYQQPPQNSLKKIPVMQIPLPPPPQRVSDTPASTATINVTFKFLKLNQSFPLLVEPTDTIAAIKEHLSSQPGAPPAAAQSLLLKGKALTDTKLLKEYNVKDGDTINIMVKPGVERDPAQVQKTSPLQVETGPEAKPRKHQRIPSLVLSPSPSSVSPSTEKPLDIPLTLDPSTIPSSPHAEVLSTYHNTVSEPAFWSRMRKFLQSEFSNESDALQAFEDYLCASKGSLTASEIAKIRDEVGVIGMAGT